MGLIQAQRDHQAKFKQEQLDKKTNREIESWRGEKVVPGWEYIVKTAMAFTDTGLLGKGGLVKALDLLLNEAAQYGWEFVRTVRADEVGSVNQLIVIFRRKL